MPYGAGVRLPVLLLLGVPAWGAAQILNAPVIVVYRFGLYGFGFLLGYYVFSHEVVTDRLKAHALPLLAAALLLGGAYTYVTYGENFAQAPAVNSPLAIGYAWVMCLALIGCFKKWADRSSPFRAFLARKSFGLYVFHYLALSSAAYLLTKYTNLPALPVYLLVTAAAFAGGLSLYEIISRIPVIRWCVLGNRHASTICKTRESLGIQGFRLNLKICFFHVFYPAFLSFFQACFYRLFRIE